MLNPTSKYKDLPTTDYYPPDNTRNIMEWLQNPKIILDEMPYMVNKKFINYFVKTKEQFYIKDTSDSVLKNAKLFIKEGYPDFNKDLHIKRDKKICTVIIGDEWSYGDELLIKGKKKVSITDGIDQIDQRITNTIAGNIMEKLDCDCYMSYHKDNNSTSMLFSLYAILLYLQHHDYKKINVVFQMAPVERCVKSEFWHEEEFMTRSFESTSPRFGNDEDRQVFFTRNNGPENGEIYKPWAFFWWHMTATRDTVIKNTWDDVSYWPYGIMSYSDWFRYYDNCILQIIDAICDQYTNVDHIVWKSKNNFCSDDEFQQRVIKRSWLEQILTASGVDSQLPLIYEKSWWVERFSSYWIVNPFLGYEFVNLESKDVQPILQQYQNNFIGNDLKKLSDLTLKLEKLENEYFFSGYPQPLAHKQWAEYIVQQAGWHK